MKTIMPVQTGTYIENFVPEIKYIRSQHIRLKNQTLKNFNKDANRTGLRMT